MDMTTVETFVRTTLAGILIKVLAAIAFWLIGRWLITRVIRLVQAGMQRNAIDPTLTRYLGSIISVALNIALVLGIVAVRLRRGVNGVSVLNPPGEVDDQLARRRSHPVNQQYGDVGQESLHANYLY